jgi:hypothetical protein
MLLSLIVNSDLSIFIKAEEGDEIKYFIFSLPMLTLLNYELKKGSSKLDTFDI